MQDEKQRKYYTTIGLEIHAELKTATKMFCSCKNDPDEEKPNVNICPVCMAHPATLPVPNKKAIESVIKVGLALGSEIADFSEFDRKNYFYPDIPKGYQISQYKYPIVSGGKLAGMDLTRIHLEEDTGTSKHIGDTSTSLSAGYTLIDFNRAGVPLMELVTEAHTFDNPEDAAKCASNFAKEYQLLLWYLGVSEANMEKGEMRVEANVSISPDKDNKWPAYVEVKNLNSFRSAEKAIKYEVDRMIELFESGRESEIVKETRGWDENKQKTISQRKKESSQDYRYFPDPDLPKMKLHEAFDLEAMKKNLPETPAQKRDRYKTAYGIKDEDIEVYINDLELGKWFEEIIVELSDNKDLAKVASNYITTDFIGLRKNNPEIKKPSAFNFAELVTLIFENKISSRAGKDILAMIVVEDASPLKIATEKDLLQKNDTGALTEIAQKIIAGNEKVVSDYKGGKEVALMSLVGQMMKETKGSANPQVAKQLLMDLLK
ncbi:MAG: Asp-tRNA(Asn)/Glu-tRNA(Gln) amidotransferase subunit GatB [Candidatus Nomurabacteria bacterium]|nr:Asp-tRNA(Asn)/Glu-tRNA(Gln) amidotransferase subunit GatB [Candidatus Nomurabacteria bacterium]